MKAGTSRLGICLFATFASIQCHSILFKTISQDELMNLLEAYDEATQSGFIRFLTSIDNLRTKKNQAVCVQDTRHVYDGYKENIIQEGMSEESLRRQQLNEMKERIEYEEG